MADKMTDDSRKSPIPSFLSGLEVRYGLILGLVLILTIVTDFQVVRSPADLLSIRFWPLILLAIPMGVLILYYMGLVRTGFPPFREALLSGVMISLVGSVVYSVAQTVYLFYIFPERTEWFLMNEAAALSAQGLADSTIVRLKETYLATRTPFLVLFKTTFENLSVGAVSALILIPVFQYINWKRRKGPSDR